MFDLEKSDRNEITVHVKRAGKDLTLYYKDPETTERMEYSKNLIKRVKDKLVDQSLDTRLEYGLKIVTGIPEKMFGFKGRYISSDPESPDYREDWKELLKASASDVITQVAYAVFEGVEVLKIGTENEDETEKESSL